MEESESQIVFLFVIFSAAYRTPDDATSIFAGEAIRKITEHATRLFRLLIFPWSGEIATLFVDFVIVVIVQAACQNTLQLP